MFWFVDGSAVARLAFFSGTGTASAEGMGLCKTSRFAEGMDEKFRGPGLPSVDS